MESSNSQALRLLSLQYELALLIGQDLRLIPMLRHFFTPALKAMRCRAVHVWLRSDTTSPLERRFSYPARDALIWSNNPQFAEWSELLGTIPGLPRKMSVNARTQLLQMPMGNIGHCVLVYEGAEIDHLMIEATLPIFARLATACRASMDHERVEQLQAQALEGKKRLRTVLETVGETILQTDNTGNLTFLNAEWSRLTGEEIGQSLGRPLVDYIHAEDAAHFEDVFRTSLSSHGTLTLEARLRSAGSATRWVTIRLRRGYTDADVSSVTGTMLDITEQRNAERIKREFTATVSHELRTPLTVIDSAVSLLISGAAGPLPDAARKLIVNANKNTKRLRMLIDDLLDIEKLMAGKLSFSMREIELVSLLDQALSEHQSFADSHGVRVRVGACDDKTRVYTDPDRFQQVMNNLLSNAVKFSPDNGEVWVTVQPIDQAVRLTIRDQGPGIATDFQSQIFEKFAQADSSDTRKRGGTGLGLAITKEIVEQMHGRIGFDSPPGEGAAFWFELPTHSTA
ncbi:MAG: ATP-binding protein [Pseudohongiella sp.]|nr:ATP-binding protein [Pseudohongiella sp.]